MTSLTEEGLPAVAETAGDTTVVLIHPVGGNLFCYADLIAALGGRMPVAGFERVARHVARHEDRSLESIALRYADAAKQTGQARFVVAGWSLGGVIAHEVAARLGAELVLLDSWAISLPEQRDQLAATAAELVMAASRSGRKGLSIVDDIADVLTPLGADLQALRESPPQQLAGLLRDWAGLLTLAARHEPQPAPIRARLYTGADHPPGTGAAMAASWAGLCAGLWHETVPGDHFGILRPPGVTRIAEALLGLDQAG